jgi:hypothetical protein
MSFSFPSIPATPQGLLIKIGIAVVVVIFMLATLKFYGNSQYELGKAEAVSDRLKDAITKIDKLQESADVITTQTNTSAEFMHQFDKNQQLQADRIILSVKNKKLTAQSATPGADCVPSRDFGEAWNALGKGSVK